MLNKFIKLTLITSQPTYINIDEIVEVRAYTGQVHTFAMEANDEYGSAQPYKMVASEPGFVKNGTMIFIKNFINERIVTESIDQVINAITQSNKTRS